MVGKPLFSRFVYLTGKYLSSKFVEQQDVTVPMPHEIRDTLKRASLYGEVLREGAILLAIFGPIASLEIIRSIPLKLALVIWGVSVVLLVTGVEFEVRVKRKERELENMRRGTDLLENILKGL
jgi:hypothetical protein